MQAGLAAGVRLGRYEIVRLIGRGGGGAVYLARSSGPEGFERSFALKVRQARIDEPGALTEEAKLLQDLRHSNVVQVFELGRDGEIEYVAMEYVDGISLGEALRRGRDAGVAMPVGLALYVGLELCKAMHYVHGRADAAGRPLGLVHRDISPANVLLSWAGEVKLADFGIAERAAVRAARGASGAAATAVVEGKPGYLAPEQAAGIPLDVRADLFSAGISIYEACAGRNPLLASDPAESVRRSLEPRLAALSQVVSGVDASVDAFFARALARSRDERFASAFEMRRALEVLPPLHTLETPDVALATHLGGLAAAGPRRKHMLADAARLAMGSIGSGGTPTPGPSTREVGAIARSSQVRPRLAALAVLGLIAAGAAWLLRPIPTHDLRPVALSPAAFDAAAGGSAMEHSRSTEQASGTPTWRGPVTTPAPVVSPPPAGPSAATSAPSGPSGTRATGGTRPSGTATLRVNVEPWAEVILDGKNLGHVPWNGPVASGRRVLTLRNPQLGFEKSVALTLGVGEVKTVSEWPR